MEDKRFIEESFPVKEVSEESAKEKSVRHGHISTLHIWWARRPLASSRATNYAALIPAPKDDAEWDKKKQFIIDLCKWGNSNNRHLIDRARKDILEANGGKPPKVLDPFAGGGAIPLEALRLGCETYAGEYNPVANLILKCTLEYPQKYGRPKEKGKDWNFLNENRKNPLIEDVRTWGDWILNEVEKEIGAFYPNEKDGSIPIGYLWTRTIPCQNPSCRAEIPLIRQYWLAKKEKKNIALRPYVKNGKVEFEIVDNPRFDPSKGTIKGAVANCLVCGTTVDERTIKKLFREKKSSEKMIAVIANNSKSKGKIYRIANKEDLQYYEKSACYFEKKRKKYIDEWGVDPVPDEIIHTPDGNEYKPGSLLYNFTPVVLYGMTKWQDLFNSRQKLAIITFIEKLREANTKLSNANSNKEYIRAVVTYLALGVDRLVDFGSSLCVLNPTGGRGVVHTFGRQALQMIWDYTESNPLNPFGAGWPTATKKNQKWIEHASKSSDIPAIISQSSAHKILFPDNYFEAVFTDPPYYDNVPYSDISDFFYVWLKRSIGDLYPELFSTPLTPKSKEIIAELPLLRGMNKDKASQFIKRVKTKEHFESKLKESFREIHRILRPYGIATIVYTHKSTSGWETLINSLLDSGLVITASWPLHTEMRGRLRAQESAALASSIYFVARKIKREQKGWYNEVKEEIKKHLYEKLERLWEEGLSGADFFVAGIGSAIEIFGKYEKVLDYEGNVIKADKLLDFVRDVVTDYAVRQILHNGIAGELSPLTKFYILWRWTYQDAKVPFDDARKLAQSAGIDLSKEWNRGFIRKEKEFIKVLGPQDRKIKEVKGSKELIDVLHHALNLWKEGKTKEMNQILMESSWGNRDSFYRVADAISKTLIQKKNKENQLLDGFLSRKKQILSEVSKVKQKQLDLFMNKGRE